MSPAAPPPRRRPRAGRQVPRGRGSVSVQMVILVPALFAVMFLGAQAALIYQARTVALAAAQEGARSAAAEDGTTSAGISTAAAFIAQSTSGVSDTRVSGSRSATTATIRVRTRCLSVIPGWTPAITQSASLPVERLTR